MNPIVHFFIWFKTEMFRNVSVWLSTRQKKYWFSLSLSMDFVHTYVVHTKIAIYIHSTI